MEQAEERSKFLEEARAALSESEESVETDIESLHRTRETWEKEKAEEQKGTRRPMPLNSMMTWWTSYNRLFESKNGNAIVGLDRCAMLRMSYESYQINSGFSESGK